MNYKQILKETSSTLREKQLVDTLILNNKYSGVYDTSDSEWKELLKDVIQFNRKLPTEELKDLHLRLEMENTSIVKNSKGNIEPNKKLDDFYTKYEKYLR